MKSCNGGDLDWVSKHGVRLSALKTHTRTLKCVRVCVISSVSVP